MNEFESVYSDPKILAEMSKNDKARLMRYYKWWTSPRLHYDGHFINSDIFDIWRTGWLYPKDRRDKLNKLLQNQSRLQWL